MELGEAFFYFRQACIHHENLRKNATPSREGHEVETESWVREEPDDSDEDESVSVEQLLDA